MWKSVLAASGVLSGLVILLSVAVALGGRGGDTKPQPRVAVIEADEGGTPDPSASGVIVARAGNMLYRFAPDGTQLGVSQENTFRVATSVSGMWQGFKNCPASQSCQLLVGEAVDGAALRQAALAGGLAEAMWSPVSDVLAVVEQGGSVSLVDPTTLAVTPLGEGATAYGWTSDGVLVFATFDGEKAQLWAASSGHVRLVSALGSPVTTLVPSPDGRRFAFVQDGAGGWQAATVGGDGRVVVAANLGRMNSFASPVTRAPASVAMSWSPGSDYVAVSPVAKPYVMYIAGAGGDAAPLAYYLDDGYAGEMKWSPDGSQLAISTYSVDRTRHNVYLLESLTATELRFMIDGCVVFWSPDGRFLVNHREPRTGGIAAVRVSDGAFWLVTPMLSIAPASWAIDEQTALKLADLPPRGVGGLGK